MIAVVIKGELKYYLERTVDITILLINNSCVILILSGNLSHIVDLAML